MKIGAWAKPAVYGLLVGGATTAFVGFSWGGWMTSSGADKMANERAAAGVTAALVPVCVGASQADPNRIEKLAAIKDAASFRRGDAVLATGWAVPPGEEASNRALAVACLGELDLDAS